MNNQLSALAGELATPEFATPELATSVVAPEPAVSIYQAPAIESIVTFENLQREVFYAGSVMTVVPIP